MFRDDYKYLWEEADEYIQAERKQYIDVYKTIDQYISDNEILVSGQLSINLIQNVDNADNYFYDLYSSGAFVHATRLSNKITEKCKGRIVRMVTVAAYKVYNIFVDTRLIVILNDVKVRSGTNYLRMVEPIMKTLREQKVLVISPEIQLLGIYRKLYLPSHAGEWETLLNNEVRLFNFFLSRKTTIEKKEGGKTPTRAKIDGALMEYISRSNKILIGEHACEILTGVPSAVNFIEVISFAPLEQDIMEIKEIVKNITSEPINAITRNLEIIGDYRLERTSIKLGLDRPREIMYIYNSTDYDLIPYNIIESTKRSLWIGNPFVILRFLLVNLWIIRRVREMGLIDEKFASIRIENIFKHVIELRKKLLPFDGLLGTTIEINADLIASDQPLSVFQSDRYVGNFVSEEIAFKIERREMTEKFPDYYPLNYLEKFGHFREI